MAWQHQAIIWCNVDPDLCHYMMSSIIWWHSWLKSFLMEDMDLFQLPVWYCGCWLCRSQGINNNCIDMFMPECLVLSTQKVKHIISSNLCLNNSKRGGTKTQSFFKKLGIHYHEHYALMLLSFMYTLYSRYTTKEIWDLLQLTPAEQTEYWYCNLKPSYIRHLYNIWCIGIMM